MKNKKNTTFHLNLSFWVICSFFLFLSEGYAQMSDLKYGKLDNGLTYYIKKDESFSGEVNFYLYQNVGSILEEDKEQGVAHFLEHMAFNATKNFPNGIMTFLRENGIKSFNATTGVNETRYVIYNIPSDNTKLIENSLLILKDWSNGILIKPSEVEKERKIISEEWRARRDINKRLSENIAKSIYNHSKYTYRNTIGTEKGIASISAKDIRKFYEKWYIPNLQCIVIVGDIDIDDYESKVKEIFSSIPKAKNHIKRPNIEIADNTVPNYYHFIDKENVSNSFGIYQRIDQKPLNENFNDTKQQVFSMLFNQLVSRRLSMLQNDGQEMYVAASVSYDPLVRQYDQNSWDVVPYEGQELKALKQILNFREDLMKNGFQKDEFEEVRENIYKDIKSTLERKENLGTPDNYMTIFKQNFLYNTPIISFREQIENLANELLEMEVEDLNDWKNMWMDNKNLSFITYSSSANEMNISLEKFCEILKESKGTTVVKAKKLEPIKNLIDFEIKAGKIISEKTIENLQAKEWILSNGAKILYKYIPDMGDKTFFIGSALGGNSLVKPKDIASDRAMTALIMRSGLYKYSRNQLHDWIKNKDFDLSLNTSQYTDGIGGRTDNENIEDFFKYLYLVINKQKFDKKIFDKYLQKKIYIYKNKKTEGITAVQDSIQDILFPPSDKNPRENMKFYKDTNYKDLQRLFNNRYGDANQFTFCLITSVPEEKAKKLISKYIASLPGNPNSIKRNYKIVDNSSPEQKIIKEFFIETDNNIGEVEIAYINDKKLSEKEQKILPLIENILHNKLFGELREKQGGVYSIGVKIDYEAVPIPLLKLNIHYSTESDKVEMMKKLTYEIISDVVRNNFSQEEFNRVFVPFVLSEESEKKAADNDKIQSSNPFLWINILNAYAENRTVEEIQPNKVIVRNITKEDVGETLKTILNGAKHRDIVIKSIPKEKKEWKLHTNN